MQSPVKSWADLIADANTKKQGKSLIHLIHSPKNIGSNKIQSMWYTAKDKSEDAEFKILQRDDGDWDTLIREVNSWLNNFIPPHALISISLFEDAHPNEGKGINACITHSAGSNPKDLNENEATNVGPLYDVDVVSEDSEWEDMFNEAVDRINERGDEVLESHIIASTNNSSTEGGKIAIFSWSLDDAEALTDPVRPTDCTCSCTLF